MKYIPTKMRKIHVILLANLLFCFGHIQAEEVVKSSIEEKAEASVSSNIANARSLYIRAFEDYTRKGQLKQGVLCGAKATALYYKENLYQEAFDLVRNIEQTINNEGKSSVEKAEMRYWTSKERMAMYLKLKRQSNVQENLNAMENWAKISGSEEQQNDLLYNKAIVNYSFGKTSEGNAIFKEMADKLTKSKQYDKVEEVYKTLIANGRRSNSVSMVAQSYSSYMAWKDSINALKSADEIKALKDQIAANEQIIVEKDSSLSSRQLIIIGLCVLAAALAAVLVAGAVILLRFILLTRQQKKIIKLANETNAAKSKFIGNISAQLEPTLKKLDNTMPEVKALLEFSAHVQQLSALENDSQDDLEMEEVQMPKYCEELMDQIREKVANDVSLTINASKMSATIYTPYVSHILLHLLNNAAHYTPEGGSIWLDFKKRGPHTFQFIVSDTGTGIPEEKAEDVFKPFREVRDLTKGDGLGLPICKQMALKMNGDLDVDLQFTKGARFVLNLHS